MACPEIQATGVNAQVTTPNEELPSSKFWDQVSENPKDRTDECRHRVGCNISEVENNRILEELIYAQQNNTAKIHTLILGPPGTPYDGRDSTRGTAPNQQLPFPSFWFLVSSEREGPTGKWRRRVGCDIHKAEFYRVNEVFISAEHNTAKIHALILEPPATPYQGNTSARRTVPNHWLPPPSCWCLVLSEHEGPTDECRRRVGFRNREVQFYRDKRVSFSATENTAKTSGLVIRPAGTAFDAGNSARGNTPKKQHRSAYCWDLVSYEREESTNKHRCRVGCGIRKAEFYRVARVFVGAENNTAKIPALIMGPPGTPYEGGFFQFLNKCPPDYLDSSLRVRLMTTDAGCVRFGPRFYKNVTACLDHLGSLYETTWTFYWYLLNVMFTIKFLLTPEMRVSQGSDFAVLLAIGTWLSENICYNAVLRHESTLAAVCDAVEESLRPTMAWPRYHRDEVVEHFPQFCEEY